MEQDDLERARSVYRELLEVSLKVSGEMHPSSLAAKGDLSTVLFELGQLAEVSRLERQAFDVAQEHLGRKHPVCCVLAWNRALRCEASGDMQSEKAGPL